MEFAILIAIALVVIPVMSRIFARVPAPRIVYTRRTYGNTSPDNASRARAGERLWRANHGGF